MTTGSKFGSSAWWLQAQRTLVYGDGDCISKSSLINMIWKTKRYSIFSFPCDKSPDFALQGWGVTTACTTCPRPDPAAHGAHGLCPGPSGLCHPAQVQDPLKEGSLESGKADWKSWGEKEKVPQKLFSLLIVSVPVTRQSFPGFGSNFF